MSEQHDRQGQDQNADNEAQKARVDEAWKESVQEEQQRLREEARETGEAGETDEARQAGPKQYPEPDFRVFMAGLYTQTLVALGEVESPASEEKEQNLPEAQYLIDTIDMLKKKTEGNLTNEEETYLGSLLHDLRMRYVTAASQSKAQQQ